jgi:hypothetical protein
MMKAAEFRDFDDHANLGSAESALFQLAAHQIDNGVTHNVEKNCITHLFCASGP